MKKLTDGDFKDLLAVLKRVPTVDPGMGFSHDVGRWWGKFALDINHPLAWEVVQEFGHVLPPFVFKKINWPFSACRSTQWFFACYWHLSLGLFSSD